MQAPGEVPTRRRVGRVVLWVLAVIGGLFVIVLVIGLLFPRHEATHGVTQSQADIALCEGQLHSTRDNQAAADLAGERYLSKANTLLAGLFTQVQDHVFDPGPPGTFGVMSSAEQSAQLQFYAACRAEFGPDWQSTQ